MKHISIAIITILLFVGCLKIGPLGSEAPKKYFVIDSNVYFKVNINNKTLSTYGIVINGKPGGALSEMSTVTNSSGLHTGLVVQFYGSSLNPIIETAPEQCDAEFFLTKAGGAIGSYKHDTAINRLSYIVDLTAGNTKYFFDENSITFNVTKADSPYVQGAFSGNLLNGSPVNGTYNLTYSRR